MIEEGEGGRMGMRDSMGWQSPLGIDVLLLLHLFTYSL